MQSDFIQNTYPSLLEAIRFLAVSFDLKASNKAVDNKLTANIDPRELDGFISGLFVKSIGGSIGSTASKFINEHIHLLRKRYIGIIKDHNADGITRVQLLGFLKSYVLPNWIAQVYMKLKDEFGGPSTATLFVEHNLAVPVVLDWVDKTYPEWKGLLKSQPKEQQDKLARWAKGIELPSISGIGLLGCWITETKVLQDKKETIQLLVLMARAVDFWRKSDDSNTLINSVLLQLWHEPQEVLDQYQMDIAQIKIASAKKQGVAMSLLDRLWDILEYDTSKGLDDKDITRKDLDLIRDYFRGHDLLPGMQYRLDWAEATWHVFSGDLKAANEFYRKAFDAVLYQGGSNVEDIIYESLVIASSLDIPDQVFLKHLKWASIQFEYDIPSITSLMPDKTFSGSVESWEVQAWKNNFYRCFPKKGLFLGTEFDEDLNPIIHYQTKKNIAPDYRNPNRKIKVDEVSLLKMPQLNWFIIEEDYDAFCNLLERGANPNVLSDSKDTPLQLSLHMLSVRAVAEESFDDRFFWRLAELPHDEEIINQPSAKKRHLPLILAVESGRPEIVDKVLQMGANPNQRGQTDEQTALNVCLKLIEATKNPEAFKRTQLSHPITAEYLDSIRRHTAGFGGMTLEQNKQLAELMPEANFPIWLERHGDKLDLDKLRNIASMLILAGADVNAEHNSPIKGYTPLMLAAENNEDLLFQLMLEKGGKPKKSYYWEGRNIDCWGIAEHFNSADVLNVLKRMQFQ